MGKTRAQTRKMSESDEKEKPTVKRTTTMAQTAKVLYDLDFDNVTGFGKKDRICSFKCTYLNNSP